MRRAAIALGLLLVLAAPAWGGSLGLMYSYWSTDEADEDDGIGVRLDLDVGSAVDFEIRATFFDNFLFPEAAPVFEIEAQAVDIGLGYDFQGRKVTPYIGVGLSYVFFNTDIRPVNPQPSARLKDEAGWYVLGGLEAPIGGRFEVFGEVFYRMVEAELQGDDLGSLTNVGVDFTGPGANVGVQLAW